MTARAITCPRCRHRFSLPPVLYGYPTQEALDAAERGEITIGGCLPDLAIERACPSCGVALVIDPSGASARVADVMADVPKDDR